MSDDLEPRLQEAFHGGSLPPAPGSLADALQRVPDVPVRSRRRAGGRSVFGLLAAAALLVTAGALAIGVGSRPESSPTPSPAPTPAGSVAVAPQIGTLHVEYKVLPVAGVAPTKADMAREIVILGTRLQATGAEGPVARVQGTDRIIVDLPGVTDPDPVMKLMGQVGRVDFVPLGTTQVNEGQTIDLNKNPPLFGGDQVASASVATYQDGQRAIDFVLTSDAARLFADYTAKNVGGSFAITVDGVVISTPFIQNEIPNGEVQITGAGPAGFSATDASTFATILDTGALPFPIQVISSEVRGQPGPS